MTKLDGPAGSALLADCFTVMVANLWLDVPPESLAHGGEDFLRKSVLGARAKARIERSGENIRRHRFLDRGLNGPAALAGILDEARIGGEGRILRKRGRGEIEQPGGDHAAAPPHLRYVRNVEVEALGLRQVLAAGVLENIEALRVGLHQAVLDAVVHHLDEM